MATTRKQRLDVGRAVYEHRITKYEAARQNHVTESCVTNWLKLYLSKAGIPYTKDVLEISEGGTARDYSSMTKEELVHELMLRNFEVFHNGTPLDFAYCKSKEVFAFLVDREGAAINLYRGEYTILYP